MPQYKVAHLKWELFTVDDYEIITDFGRLYDAKFAFLNEAKPHSIFMAKGSKVAVYKGARI